MVQQKVLQELEGLRDQLDRLAERSREEPEEVASALERELRQLGETLGEVLRVQQRWRREAARSRSLVEAAIDGIITIDHRGIIQSVNPAAERMFGYSAEELLGENVKVLMPSPDREWHDGYIERYLETGQKKIIGTGREVIGRRKDGRPIPVDLAVSEIEVAGERSFVGILRDLTSRRETEELLAQERDFAERLVETAPAIVLLLDPEGRILRFNRYTEELTGYRLAEVEGEEWFARFLPERERSRIRAVFRQVIAEGGATGVVNPIVTRDGEERQIEWASTILRHGQGTHVLAVGQDITTRCELEEQVRQSQKMEAVGRLAGGVAHDFNTLLASILGYGEMLLDKIPPGDALRNPVEQIQRGAERGADLTRQLLTFSRRQESRPEPLSLNDVILGMDDMLSRLMADDVEIVHRLAPELGAVEVDRGQLEQVLMNLVVNAGEAMPEGGRITLTTEEIELGEEDEQRKPRTGPGGGRWVVLSVSDTGAGFDEQTRSRLFEPFFTTKPRGTGLGLATVYGIVRQHGGTIEPQSRPGQGATFRIFLPWTEATLGEGAVDEATARVGETSAGREMGGETILLVEDDEMFRTLLQEVLEEQGYRVRVAAHPEEALQLASAHEDPVDLLISDMVMPGMGGQALSERLQESCPEMLTILMSGYSDEELVDRQVSDAGIPFLQKPFRTRDLLVLVRQLLEGEELCDGRREIG